MRILLIFAFLNIICLNKTKGQDVQNVKILNADKTYADSKKHPEYWRLINNVIFTHNNTFMYCDSAYHYSKKDKIIAFGKIKINQGDSIIVTGKKLTYVSGRNTAIIEGDVKLIDKNMLLETNRINYNLKTNIASYPNKGKITESEKVINSIKGSYHSNIHTFIFKDSVKVLAQDYTINTDNMHYDTQNEIAYFYGPSKIISNNKIIYCENGWYNTITDKSQFKNNAYLLSNSYILKGDSLYYSKNDMYAKAIGHVAIIDTIENIILNGGIAEYFEDHEKAIIKEKPILNLILENDTLFMHAKKFINFQHKGSEKILAYNKVKMYKSDFQGKCDSLTYIYKDSIIEMHKSPIIWSNNFQITSDTIQFVIHKNKIDKMYLNSNPILISKEDSIDYNQISGKKMISHFNNNKITRTKVLGNGETIFISKDENDKKIGITYLQSSDLTLYFKNNKLNNISYLIQPNSETIPIDKVSEDDRYLTGFKWRGAERPMSKEEIFKE